MAKTSLEIYRDQDDDGTSYTIYKDGHFVGEFLSDDPTFKRFIVAGADLFNGIDNRSSK